MPGYRQHKTLLILVGGLPATGKTWFAQALAERLGAVHINSDEMRTKLRLRGKYDLASKQQVYDAMCKSGDHALKNGKSVIVDSTFYKKKLRQAWQELAAKHNADCHFIEITVPEAVAFERLKHKRKDSEADREVYLKIKAAWEEIEAPHLTLNSSSLSLAEMTEQTEQYLTKDHDTRTG